MPLSIRSATLALLAVLSPAMARPRECKASSSPKAVYFITNNDTNAVVAVPVGADGTLSGGVLTPTGGNGAISIDGSTNAPAARDGLVSQSSLSIAGKHLFAVNAGSNTVSMFAIDPADPSKLTMVGKPAAVPGEFTNTVAASAKNKLVCVGATGAVAGISCASFNARSGIAGMDKPRALDIKQSTPPVGPTNTLSQVFWSNDERTLFATVKGDPAKNNTGFLAAFPVKAKGRKGVAALSERGVKSSPSGTAVLFGSLPIPGSSNIFATDASFGAAVLSVDKAGHGSLVAAQPIDGQKATCWVTISPASDTAFVTDVATPRLVEMSLKDASIVGQVDLASTGATGMIDLKASGDFLYALAPGSGNASTQVLVMDVRGGSKAAKLVQQFDAGALGAGAVSQGMVVLSD